MSSSPLSMTATRGLADAEATEQLIDEPLGEVIGQRPAADQHSLEDDPVEQVEQQLAVRVWGQLPALSRAVYDGRGGCPPLRNLFLVGPREGNALVLGGDQNGEIADARGITRSD